MKLAHVSDTLTVSPQLGPDDMRAVAAAGFRVVICNRPDGEEPNQPTVASLQDAAEATGLDFHHIPVSGGEFPPVAIKAFAKVREEADGKVLAFVPLRQDIWALDIDSDKPPWPLVQTRFDEYTPAFSPDGRWLAYGSNESGRREVYVVPYPGLDGRYQIATQGGAGPTWAGNGRELFYHRLENGNLKMMAVDIATEPEFRAGLPQQVFEGPYVAGAPVRSYDVTPDGQRFLMVRKGNPRDMEPVAEMHLILNWTKELKRLVPTGN